LEEADIQKFLSSHAAELIEESLEQLTALSEDEEDSETVVQRPQLTTGALKKGLQMVSDLVVHLFEVEDFVERRMKFKHTIEAYTSS
jgi:hypothetical protein